MSKNKEQKHVVTQEDLDKNPELVTQVVELGSEAPTDGLVEELKQQLAEKSSENESLKSELKAKDEEIANLKTSIETKSELLESDLNNTDGKVIVHFGVNISGKDYAVADILADKDIQKHLFEIGSGAIEKVTKG